MLAAMTAVNFTWFITFPVGSAVKLILLNSFLGGPTDRCSEAS